MDEPDFPIPDVIPLFGPGICESCGKPGQHDVCEARKIDIARRFRDTDLLLLQQHAVQNAYGIAPASRASFERAAEALQAYLRQPLRYNAQRVIEGDSWWFIDEGWIGVIGFVVEKRGGALFALGSARPVACTYSCAHWDGILAYLAGRVEAVSCSLAFKK